MEVNIRDLINRVQNFKHRIQEELSADDDYLLAVTLAVLEEVEELDKTKKPMKVKAVEYAENKYVGGCPACNGHTLLSKHYAKVEVGMVNECHCMHCGQRLDWSNDAEDE